MRRTRVLLVAGAVAALSASPAPARADDQVKIPGLRAAASVVRDADGVPHIKAANGHDLFFLQGWQHAEDRLFQMDVTRRRASGTLAELVGRSALPSDVQMRTLGLRRSAERTMAVLSPKTRDDLRAYADGVNAWIARNELPGQYASVQVTKAEPWSVVDSVLALKLVAFGLSFDLDIDRTTAVQAYDAAGLDGRTAVFGDLSPFAPFNQASPVIDATRRSSEPRTRTAPAPTGEPGVSAPVARMAARYLKRAKRAPAIVEALNRDADRGSNSWVIGGEHTANGRPILASDPHLGADSPALFSPIELEGGGFDAQGDSIAGSPYIILGQNRDIAFGATTHFTDVTDTYVEQVRSDPASPSGLSTLYNGRLEPVKAIDETFRVNPRTPGGRTRSTSCLPVARSPRRRSSSRAAITGRSSRSTGRRAGRCRCSTRASRRPPSSTPSGGSTSLADVNDFREALQYFDVGTQNFLYADRKGSIAYFTNAEVPIREDLQAGKVDGNPPYLLRDGTGGNEWLTVRNRQPHQSVPYEIVPFREMPQTVNPRAGFVVSSNNDPTGKLLRQRRPQSGPPWRWHLLPRLRPQRVPGRPRDRHAADGCPPRSNHGGRRREHAGGHDHHRRSVLHTDHHGGGGARRDSSTPELVSAGEGPAHRRGGRPARPAEPTTRPASPRGMTPPTATAAHRRHRRSTTAWRPRSRPVARPAFAVNVLDKHVQQISPQLPSPATSQRRRRCSSCCWTSTPAGRGPVRHRLLRRAGHRRRCPTAATSSCSRASPTRSTWPPATTSCAGVRRLDPARATTAGASCTGSRSPRPLGAPYTIPSQANRRTSPSCPGCLVSRSNGGIHVPDVAGHPLQADTRRSSPFRSCRTPLRGPGHRGSLAVGGLAARRVSEDLGSRFEQNLLGDWLTNETYPVRDW